MANAKPCFVVEKVEWEDDETESITLWEDRDIIGVFEDKLSAKAFIEEEARGTDYPCKWRPGTMVYSGVLDLTGYQGGIRYKIHRSTLFF